MDDLDNWEAKCDWVRKRYGDWTHDRDTTLDDVALIDQYLFRFNEPAARLYALQEFERIQRQNPRLEHSKRMIRALAIWRLRAQELDLYQDPSSPLSDA